MPPATQLAPELAWSQEPDPDGGAERAPQPSSRVLNPTVGAVVAIGLAASAALVALYVHHVTPKPFASKHDSDPLTCGEAGTIPCASALPTAATKGPALTVPPTRLLTPEERDAAFVAEVAPKLPARYNDRLPALAREICLRVGDGEPVAQVIQTYLDKHPDDPDLTYAGLSFFVNDAIRTYCPQYVKG